MVGPLDILEPGGNLVVVSECSEGIGSAEYTEAQRRLIALGPEGFLEDIGRKSHADIDEWQTQMQLRPQRVAQIHLFSEGLKGPARALTGVHMVDSVADTLAECVRAAGDTSIAVVPEGPYVVPVYRPQAAG
jgi:nickel-dependent lactate racemase